MVQSTVMAACYSTATVHTDELMAQSICAVCTQQLIARSTATDICYSIVSRYTDSQWVVRNITI